MNVWGEVLYKDCGGYDVLSRFCRSIKYKYSCSFFCVMLRIKRVSEVIGKKVYTSEGDFFGQVEEVNLVDNKIEGWRIRVGSGFVSSLGGARGVVIPHQFVKAIGDVLVVNKTSLPVRDEGSEMLEGISPAGDSANEELM